MDGYLKWGANDLYRKKNINNLAQKTQQNKPDRYWAAILGEQQN